MSTSAGSRKATRSTSSVASGDRLITRRQWLINIVIVVGWLLFYTLLPERLTAIPFMLLSAWIVVGKPLAIYQAMTLSFLLVHVNPDLFGEPQTQGLHLLLPLVAAGRAVLMKRKRLSPVYYQYLRVCALLGGALILHSLAFSVLPSISIAKVTLFVAYSLAALAAALAATGAARGEAQPILAWLITVIAVVVVLNVPLLPTAVGYSRNSQGFNGVLNHPNALSVFLCSSLVLLITVMLQRKQLSWPLVFVVAAGGFQLLRTEARGGILALAITLGLWGATLLWKRSARARRALRRVVPATAAVAVLAIFFSANLHEAFKRVISKSERTRSATVGEAFMRSRGGAIEQHLATFRAQRLGGEGFQVVDTQSGEVTDVVYDPFLRKIPISARIENGFLFSSMLAEGGILGAPLMFGFLVTVLWFPYRRGGLNHAIVPLSVILLNVSEATFFSTSGVGGWGLLLIAYSISCPPPAAAQANRRVVPLPPAGRRLDPAPPRRRLAAAETASL